MGGRGPGWRGWRRYVPAVVWAGVVLWIGSRPNLTLPVETDLSIDKFGHFVVYGVRGVTWGWGWVRNGGRPAAWLLICGGILVGAVDELIQAGVPGRSAEAGDVVADALGVLTGFWLGKRWFGRGVRRGAG
jgi:VanZ family protein